MELRDPAQVHVTVFRDEVRDALPAREGGLLVDLTLGLGGHSEALLARGPESLRVIGFDRDPEALARASARLSGFGDRFEAHESPFSQFARYLDGRKVDGICADLGVSSLQLDDPARGMSFRGEGPLDMRMGRDTDETAWSLVRRLRENELADVIYQYGDERASRPIARTIKRFVTEGRMDSTRDLADAVYSVLGRPRPMKLDPATRTFQALRIAVNDELGEIERMLAATAEALKPGGVLAVIAFHSLEDRIVKHFLRGEGRFKVVTKKPLEPSDAACRENPRARSAKLRIARRVDDAAFDGALDDDEDAAPDDDRDDGASP